MTQLAYSQGDQGDAVPEQIVFSDRGGLFGLLLRNWLLTIVTLGLYRFWARARLRRYWWGSIVMSGDPLEYTGTGLELFKGFLLALVVLAPLGLLYAVSVTLLRGTALGEAILIALYLIVVFVLAPIVSFRARRYRMSRTLWRGIRGGMDGSTLAYLRITALGTLLTAVTVGIYAPYLQVAQMRYAMAHSLLGESRFRFEGRGRDLLRPWLAAFLPGLGLLILGLIPFIRLSMHQAPTSDATAPPEMMGGVLGAIGALLLAELVLAYGIVAYQFVSFKYLVNHLTLAGVAFRSKLRPLRLTGAVFWRFLLLMLLVWLAMAAAAGGVFAVAFATKLWHAKAPPSPAMVVVILLAVFVAVSAGNIFRILLVDRLVVRRIAETITIEGAGALAATRQSTLPVPRQGEAFVDSFDIGAF